MHGRGLLSLSIILLGGCEAPFSLLAPGGAQAQWLANLGWFLIVLMGVIIIGMSILVLWGALRRKGKLDEHLPIDISGGTRWILLGGVALPVTVLTALFATTLVTLNAFPGKNQGTPTLQVDVTAHQWWWEIDYRFDDLSRGFSTANELHIPIGEPVQINLKSSDVIHSFWVPRLHGKIDAIPGHKNTLILHADEPGVYRGQCAEYCGVQHAHMRFAVVAQSREKFDAWLQHQRQPAPELTDDTLIKGREAFEGYACALCHRIRGTEGYGGVAPDLTHFGSRRTIAGVMPNTRARLQAWIVNAQSFKPGARMPTLEQFDGETLNALAAYLESLE